MYVTAERGWPNDEIDQIYQGGGFSSTRVPWHGLSLLTGIHLNGSSFLSCSPFPAPGGLLACRCDTTAFSGRRNHRKAERSLPRLSKWSLTWFLFLNHVCYINVWSCQIKWHLKVSQGEPEKSLWNTSIPEVLTAWTHMNSAQMQLDFIREFPIRRKYLICSSDVTLNYKLSFNYLYVGAGGESTGVQVPVEARRGAEPLELKLQAMSDELPKQTLEMNEALWRGRMCALPLSHISST